MQDMDFSLANAVKDILDTYQVPYQEKVAGGLIYIIVENVDKMALFLFYGFFEEYVIYDRNENDETDWILRTRGELNFNFTSVANVLSDIGIQT